VAGANARLEKSVYSVFVVVFLAAMVVSSRGGSGSYRTASYLKFCAVQQRPRPIPVEEYRESCCGAK
jgi:hypothetical protein